MKSSQQRSSLLLIFLIGFSFLLWCYLFRLYLNASAPLLGDAYPYLGHIRYYIENMMRGVYPLWYPWESFGNVNEFFLRRIGEYNPFFWIIALLNKSGLCFLVAYRLFLAAYFFLGVGGFYLLSRKLFSDRLPAFTAALLLLFSCAGAGIFESYLLLETVPFIWFAYFFVAFMQAPRKAYLLGVTFCLMIVNITYIPFYFYTILFTFFISYLAVYFSRTGAVVQQVKGFMVRYKIFALACLALFLVSLVPGISWQRQTQKAEAFTMTRHAGSQDANAATVSEEKINEGGIIPSYIYDRQFVNLDKIGLHDFYISLFAFLMLLTGLWGRLNRRLLVLFIFGFILFLIGLADGSYIDDFLYKYVPFFRYFRNVHFLLQFAILPVFILFVVEQMRIFIEECQQSLVNRKWMTVWVVLVHAGAAGLFLYNHVSGITYAVIIFNLGWMLGRIWSIGSSVIWILLLWGAVVLQPFEVYSHIAVDNPPSYQLGYANKYILNLPSVVDAQRHMTGMKKRTARDINDQWLPYFGTCWLYEAMGSVDTPILINYLSVPFILYGRIQQVSDSVNIDRLQSSMAHFDNIVFVHSRDVPEIDHPVYPKARIITSADTDFKILKVDANDVIVRTAFASPGFLVRTQNYHSQWKAFIDGKSVPLFRANISAQGLWVPAGEHVVHWHFGRPGRYVWPYFLIVLYPLVLIWLICLLLI